MRQASAAFLDVHIYDDTCNVTDVAFAEYDYLLAVLHLSFQSHIHAVLQHLVVEVFLHFADIYHVSGPEFFKLFAVDVGPVHGDNRIVLVIAWSQHKRVVCSSRGKLYVALGQASD